MGAHIGTQLAAFVGNEGWLTFLIVLHVLGAVIGLGSSYGFSILGPLAGKVEPPGGLAIMEGMEKIEYGLTSPILLTIQPITGVLMIFNRGFNEAFFSHSRLWLIAGISTYLLAMVLALGVAGPTNKKMIAMAKSGQGGTPEFMALAKRASTVGPILGLLGVIIVVLMVWKPGCGFRC